MIQKIAKEDVPELLPIKTGHNSVLRANLLLLKVGEALFLPNEDWRSKKNTPYYIVARLKKTNKMYFEYGQKTDGTGWLFKRIA